MTLLRFLIRYLIVAAIAGLAGVSGTFVIIALTGGHPDFNIRDALLAVQIGGVPAAAMAFHLACARLLGRPPFWPAELLLFALVQIALPGFFRFVVRSELTGNQGICIVVAALTGAGALLIWPAVMRSGPAQIAGAK